MAHSRFKIKRHVKAGALSNPRYKVITVEEPTSLAAEAYRRVKVGLDYSSVDTKLQVIQFCSAIQGEGKSTTLLNVAATYAEEGKKVLVLDLDLRRPKLHRSFGVEDKNGITDVLAGKISLEEAIKHSDKLRFDCLNRGSRAPSPTAFLASKELAELVNKLRGQYDLIFVDCPPVLAVADCSTIATLCDGAVIVISKRLSDKNATKEAVDFLRKNGVNLLGCVFAQISGKDSSYTSGYYKKYYGYGYGYGDAKKPDSSDTPDKPAEPNQDSSK